MGEPLLGGREMPAACYLQTRGSQKSKRQGENAMEGDRSVVWGLLEAAEGAWPPSVARLARGIEIGRWLGAGTGSEYSPPGLPPGPLPPCYVEQDNVQSLQSDFSEPCYSGSCSARSWRDCGRDCFGCSPYSPPPPRCSPPLVLSSRLPCPAASCELCPGRRKRRLSSLPRP